MNYHEWPDVTLEQFLVSVISGEQSLGYTILCEWAQYSLSVKREDLTPAPQTPTVWRDLAHAGDTEPHKKRSS